MKSRFGEEIKTSQKNYFYKIMILNICVNFFIEVMWYCIKIGVMIVKL